jgi:hypothetical protein
MSRSEEEILEGYKKFRGKCLEYCNKAIAEDPTLKLVRGHYYCPEFGEQAHWWLVRPDGTIFDPTAAQFPSNGAGAYVEFDGMVNCSQCGKEMREEEATFESNYCFCGAACHMRFVGLGDFV